MTEDNLNITQKLNNSIQLHLNSFFIVSSSENDCRQTLLGNNDKTGIDFECTNHKQDACTQPTDQLLIVLDLVFKKNVTNCVLRSVTRINRLTDGFF